MSDVVDIYMEDIETQECSFLGKPKKRTFNGFAFIYNHGRPSSSQETRFQLAR